MVIAGACSKRPPVQVEEATIASLAGIPSLDLVNAYLERIDFLDRHGPALNSIIELNPDARPIAEELDRERRTRGPRSPLHGIPILIKDNIDTADQMKTTAGSLALENAPPPAQDAGVVDRLRRAGVVILGKTNLSEWANIRSSKSTSGWSGRGGLTRNPYMLDRNTSGSSSGSAAATAASLCTAAVGTETDGSIVSPSSICGLVGIKPTVGLLSGRGIIPIAHSQDTAGPMARTVRDAALLLSAMSERPANYTPFLDPNGLKGARLGVARQFFGDLRMGETLELLRSSGAELVDPVELPRDGQYQDAELDVLLYELKAGLNLYLKGRGGKSLKDIIEFNEQHADREMPYFGQEFFVRAESLGGLDSPAYLAAHEKCKAAAEGIDAAMSEHKLDAIVAPTGGPAWKTELGHGDNFSFSCSTPAAVAGYPHITVPAAFTGELPIGLSFFGRANSEGVLLRCAYAFEQASKARRAPKYIRS